MTYADRKVQLQTRAAALTARLSGIETELVAPAPQDWEDHASERETDEVLESLGLSGQQELRQIAAALDRIAAGTYGVCTKCGSAIAPGRLDLVPDTPFCTDCAV